MLKVSGLYVSPFEVEGALLSHPDVLEAAVVAWLDGEGLVKPKAFVVLKDQAKVADAGARDQLSRALQDHVKSLLAPYKYPRWVEFRADLPKTRPARSSASNCVPRAHRAKFTPIHPPSGGTRL
jgi:benzoate-CoA ligase